MKKTTSRPTWMAASWAMAMWPLWMGSKVPPSMPTFRMVLIKGASVKGSVLDGF